MAGTSAQTGREQILDQVGQACERRGEPGAGQADFLAQYYRDTTLEDLTQREPDDLAGAALSHLHLAARRTPGTVAVRVFTPTVDEHGWSTGHTVVEIVTDDMAFLVNSVSAELTRRDHALHLVVHPRMTVLRDAGGNLLQVLAPDAANGDGNTSPDLLRESWIHLEIERDPGREDPGELAAGLRRVVEDVRAATGDWQAMRARAEEIANGLISAVPPGADPRECADAVDLLRWLAEGNFTFLGYREYDLVDRDGEDVLVARPGSGLGILREDRAATPSGRLGVQARARAREPRLLVLTKANSRATVRRRAWLDYVGVKVFDDAGTVVGERRFLGLFASSAYRGSVRRIPVLRRKVTAVLERAGFPEDSHSGREMLAILETYPRDELFQIGVEDLFPIVSAVLHLQERRRTRLFLRRDDYDRFLSCLVYLPRDRYTTVVRERMQAVLADVVGGGTVDYTARVSESVLARLHFVVRPGAGGTLPTVDEDELERLLVAATRSWDEDLADAVRADCDEDEGTALLRAWGGGIPEGYKEDVPARVAVADLRRLEALVTGVDVPRIATNLYEPFGAGDGRRRFKLSTDRPVSLTHVLPHLADLGVEVTDERPYRLERQGHGPVWIYDFGLVHPRPVFVPVDDGTSGDHLPQGARARFCDAFHATWTGLAESDGLARLVLGAGLTWRQVVVLRAYARYLRQVGTTFSESYVHACLATHVETTRALVELFETRFDPELASEPGGRPGVLRGELVDAVVARIGTALESVESLDHDRILRSFLGLIQATVRTNAFADGDLRRGVLGQVPEPDQDARGSEPEVLALKLAPAAVPELPAPRPAFEIFVYSPRLEGVHLRFGAVARGGLRWSDRPEDFRTEVLGLVKAQTVKNAVIVPTGAKGGFVVKARLDPARDRARWTAEGQACYRGFVRGLLDVTDNLVPVTDPSGYLSHVVRPPARMVRHDGDDPYLVVAADKGTATFSDLANEVSAEYGYWLGDAFASGGSAGYDHKAMGITARGAWESVRRHFRELGRDADREDLTVVGIGDMSGDVFGNGMLLSRRIKLIAAFDHRHIFLDPDPDPERAFAERSRLFALPRSSWNDYDPGLFSAGGGVFARTVKSVPISPQVARRLGLPSAVTSLAPPELIRAILRAPADLLWNGGIGTYVKAADETHAEVADKANDGVRVDGAELRVRVVGEGGNLGLTQRGRVEAALRGVRLNTDALDNSAGVDCSDHEVNIKILLDRAVVAGDLTLKQRNHLLASMTQDVAELVLRHNHDQNALLGNAREQAQPMLTVHRRMISELERRGQLDRVLEGLPDDAGLVERADDGRGLTSPELAVLAAHAKIALSDALVASELPDDPWLDRVVRDYFPPALRDRFEDQFAAHPLRREIVATGLANEIVNRGGTTMVFRAQEESGAGADDVAWAFVVCSEVFDVPGQLAAVEALEGVAPTTAQTALHFELRRLLDRGIRWFLQARGRRQDIATAVRRYAPTVSTLTPAVPSLLVGAEYRALQEHAARLRSLGVPSELAVQAAAHLNVFQLLDVTEIAAVTRCAAEQVAQVYFTLSERYAVDALLLRISTLERMDRWQSLARAALRFDLYGALESLTIAVLTATSPASPLARVEEWEGSNWTAVERAVATLEEVRRLERSDLASLSVALRTLRGVVRATT